MAVERAFEDICDAVENERFALESERGVLHQDDIEGLSVNIIREENTVHRLLHIQGGVYIEDDHMYRACEDLWHNALQTVAYGNNSLWQLQNMMHNDIGITVENDEPATFELDAQWLTANRIGARG